MRSERHAGSISEAASAMAPLLWDSLPLVGGFSTCFLSGLHRIACAEAVLGSIIANTLIINGCDKKGEVTVRALNK